MGGNSISVLQKVVNDSTLDSTSKVLQNANEDAYTLVKVSIDQQLKLGNLTLKNCSLEGNIGTIDTDLKIVSQMSSSMTADLKANLTSDLTSKLQQNQEIMQELGSSFGSVNNFNQQSDLENLVKTVVDNAVQQDQIQQLLTDVNAAIKQQATAENIVCEDSKLKFNDANILLNAQISYVAQSISNGVLNSAVVQKLISDASQTQKVTQTGFATLLKAFLPLLIVAGLVFVAFILGGKTTIQALTSWKLWAVVAAVFAIYMVVAYKAQFWPFPKHYSPVLDKDGLRENNCKEDKNGPFTSLQDCMSQVGNDKSSYYYEKFWGYDPADSKCKRYPKLVNGDIIAAYNSSDECTKDNQTIWMPEYSENQTLSNFQNKFGQEVTKSVTNTCKSSTYGFYDQCSDKKLDLQKRDSLYYLSKEECEKAIAPGQQTLQYIADCQNNCQYIKSYKKEGQYADTHFVPVSKSSPFPNDLNCIST